MEGDAKVDGVAIEREMETAFLAQLVLDISTSFFQIGKHTTIRSDTGDFDEAAAEAFGLETDALQHFITDPQIRVLRVLCKDSGDGVKLSLESGEKEKPKAKRQKVPTFCLIKTLKTRDKLTRDGSVNSQLQLVTLGTEDIGTLVTFVQHSFAPLLQAHEGQEDDGTQSHSKRMPLIRKRLKELEVAMVQFQNNVEIPEVDLKIHPDIQLAADKLRDSKQTGSIDVDALGFSERLNDTGFLNDIQAGVNLWIKEIQKVTSLVNEPVGGSATQEINFWADLHRALLATQKKLTSPEVELTLAILKQAKRYLVTVTFAADHGLGPALKTVSSVMNLMKDFSLNAILSATDIPQTTAGVNAVFLQLKKVRLADEYKLSRVVSLVELISTDLAHQITTVLRTYSLVQVSYEQFDEVAKQCQELFLTWHRQLHAFQELVKDLSKRRGTSNLDRVSSLAEMTLEHLAIEERTKELHEFREQHERLRVVIQRVLSKTTDGSEDMLTDINAAYAQFGVLDVLDVSVDGTESWKTARKTYEVCIDRIEGSIIASLTNRLNSTSTADEMFRVFSKYNPLFFRPRIRSAVQQFQMRLIENVKEDVTELQVKFRAHYTYSEASRMSKLRDIPPIAGAVMWSKQIERKLHMLLNRVESVLGKGWEQHVEGKALKQVADAFLSKLDAQLIFDHWVTELVSVPTFDVRNIILNIVAKPSSQPECEDGMEREVSVAFNHQIVTLFKEVRNLEWLGYRVPFTLKMIAEDAKDKYPHAMSLDASLKTYANVCKRIKPGFETLSASYVREVRTTIAKTFTKDNEIRWHADHLGDYALDLAAKVETLSDKVDELWRKQHDIEAHVTALRTADEASFADALREIQKIVDELNLAGYANLHVFVKQLNSTLGGVLSARLETALHQWVHAFTSEAPNALVTERVHQVLLKNQVLVLEPSVAQAKALWLHELESIVATICTLDKIQSSTYDTFQPLVSTASPSRRRAKRKENSFQDVLTLLPPGLLLNAYDVLHTCLHAMEQYVLTWLQYQALWDMEAARVIGKIGTDIGLWQQLLVEIKDERSKFDTVVSTKRFGPMLVNFQQVQAQVNVKYDAWHTEFLTHFGDMLSSQVQSFYAEISAKRSLLEQHTLEAATSQVVATVTMIQELRTRKPEWQNAIEGFLAGEKVLRRQRFKFPPSWPELANVEGEWEAFLQLLQRKSDAMESQLPQLQAKIMEEHNVLTKKIEATVGDWDATKPLAGAQLPKAALELIVLFDTKLTLLAHDTTKMEAARKALNLVSRGNVSADADLLARTMEELTGLREVWESLAHTWARVEELKESLWSAVQPRKLRKQLDELIDGLKALPARVQQYEAFDYFFHTMQSYKATNALLTDLKSDAIRDRHWKQILKLLHIKSSFSELSLRNLWDAKLGAHDVALKDIIRKAQGEMALDEFLRQVSEHWTTYALELVNYQNRCRIIKGWDDMFAKLDEHLNSLQSMKQSPYYRVFAEPAETWEDKLTRVRAIFDFWIDVQRRWVYLEGIFFGSADIKQQLPKEYARFQSVDNEFVSTMKRVTHKPLILEVAAIPNLLHTLERQQDMMGSIQRALGEYLERQRAAFPRFYFVGDEDLLEMIGNSKEPKQIQRHLNKMFAGVAALDMNDAGAIVGLVSKEGEVVRLKTPVLPSEDTRINVWLAAVEAQMRATLAGLLEDALALGTGDYLSWVAAFPAQVVLLATQVNWTEQIEAVLRSRRNDLTAVVEAVEGLLQLLSERVLSDLPQDVRKKYEQLITELVHQRDVTRRLHKSQLTGADDFRWLYHMRHYVFPNESDPLKKLRICVANAAFSYGFEYLGVGERLVHTPLTERCYLTLTQALDFGMGGNPFGPAGTGKTESVKALGMQLGRFVLVFNCDENFDFQAMGRIFVGLCQVGAWGCFDEFNRLEERVLSAVSQQILTIQGGLALRKKSEATTSVIELLGKSVLLHPDVGIFVTMNPGYAGRSNLPDNLKQLFRSIAMVAPDRELIAQVMLFSQGITTAEYMAAKVVLLFNLCEDQLSKQPHYDFGLRALKSVLVSAGQLKRNLTAMSTAAVADIEAEALIRSVCDTVVPKLVASDVTIFETLLQGVFPGTDVHRVNEPELRAHIVEIAAAKQLVAHDKWVEKALQLYQVMQLRHGVMLVGPSGMGKTTAWQVLLEAMERVDGKKGEAYVIDPKAISKEQLYGTLDNTTLEWSDGVFTHLLRQVLNNIRGESEKRHWILFDGDVDPEWAENLNSVLDDNRLLTLPSGERLEIPPNVWIMMETETLKYATLATVSRCGMVWFATDTLETTHLVEHFLQSIATDTSFRSTFAMQDDEWATFQAAQAAFVAIARGLLTNSPLVLHCLEFAMAQPHIMDVDRLRLLMSMFSLLAKGLVHVAEYNDTHSDFPMTEAHLAAFTPKWLVFSIIWGFGGSMDIAHRVKLAEYFASINTTVPLPQLSSDNASLLDFEVQVKDGEWMPWIYSVPTLELESHRVLSTDVVVTTVDTVRHVEVLRGWLAQHKPLILCGPPGSGKTMTLTSTLNSLPEFELASLNFSSGTTPELILKTFAQYCVYKKTLQGTLMMPHAPGKWLVVFCDEINLPQADKYGTQRVVTFLRQLVEQGGFWKDKTWVILERIQFVGACNPPTDPGRVPLSSRFLRHAPVLLVDFPAYNSLKQIYGTFNRALLKLTPSLKAYVQPVTDAMVEVYHRNQTRFTAEMQPHYIYSPRELSRWMRAMYEAIEPLEYEIDVETLVKLLFHESLRLFMDRLVTPEERDWCYATAKSVLQTHFPGPSHALETGTGVHHEPIRFSTWLSKHYVQATTAELRKHIEARLRVFYEEELNVPLVVFDSVIDHVLRIDRVLRQPLGHLLLVGESGAGKTVLSRFVSWMNGMSVFQIKLTTNYTLANFDEDLRVVLKRCGCDGERICFIFDESNVLDAAFLERMNALLASGEVPGLFEDDEHTSLMHACREAVRRDNVTIENTDEELFKYFTKQVQRNMHVVFTMNPAAGDFSNRSKTSPALFNRCVVDWFGTWSDHALAQVAAEFTQPLDFHESDYLMPPDGRRFLDALRSNVAYTFHDAVVCSIVQFHHAVLELMHRLSKRHAKANHLSPRDYLEFIRHFVTLYGKKRAQLEDQQLHLNVGVEKIVATHDQVAALQAQLGAKEKELQRKDVEANEKLQLMVVEQNEAQKKKKETESLAADLARQDEEIRSRKAVVEHDLAQAEPALIEAQSSVNSIRKTQLDEIRALARPPNAVRLTLEAVAIMLGESALDWADLRKFIRKDDFIASVVNFDSEKLSAKQRAVINTNYLAKTDEFDYEKVNRASKACGPLFKWVVSQINYTEILHRIQPLRNEVQTLEEQSAGLRTEYTTATATIAQLEQRIQNYKQEYAALISEAQLISSDMTTVQKKVERSVALLENLLSERERWEAGSKEFETQMKTLVGDTLLSAGFLTYLGFLDHQQRKLLVEDWRDVLQAMRVPTTDGLSFVEYLSAPAERLAWAAADLPSDTLCVENAIVLARFHRFPLIIDPSGQAASFMINLFNGTTKISQTSFLDASFMKVLASAIRFGTALLVHDVENIDPILNPVLNRELYKTGGRVLIRLAGEEIDYSPDFRLFLITRDPSCRFSPDICSRVTFVNFTVTPSSLESQSLALLLKSEEPEIDAKRSALLKLQGEYNAKLRQLEDALLQQINGVQGNILDDDSVINTLESMKAEAADISRHVADTHGTMQHIELATNKFKPLAHACTQLFFTLDNLGAVHFLYQYSLSFFLKTLTTVLQSTTATDDRLRFLGDALFAQIAQRVAKGLLEDDKLTFALRVAQIYLELQHHQAGAEVPTQAEWDVLFQRFAGAKPVAAVGSLAAVVPEVLERLSRVAGAGPFDSVGPHVEANADEWAACLSHAAPETAVPSGWDEPSPSPLRSAFRSLALVATVRPDRFPFAAEAFLTAVFGADFPWRGQVEFSDAVEHGTESARGILLCSKTGFDASGRVDELAGSLQKRFASVAMGSAEGYDAADKALNTALKQGSWLLLRNVHLCPSWLLTVEKKLYAARDSCHKDFRLFLTSEIHPQLPVNLLRLCDIFVLEPPHGVKASMLRTFQELPADRVNRAPTERGRLFLLLAWFHAVVQERLRYVPIGWSKAYEFSQSDFKGACDVMDAWVDSIGRGRAHISPDAIPWTAIKVILKESLYGGRVDNKFDQALLDTLLDGVFCPESYDASFALVESVVIAAGKTKEQFGDWIHALPNANSPRWLGLPSSAESMLLTNQGARTLRQLQLMQDSLGLDEGLEADDAAMTFGGAGDARPAWIQALGANVAAWRALLPADAIEAPEAAFDNPVFRCLHREIELANTLLATVTDLLTAIAAVCANTLKPSNAVREAMRALHQGVLPVDWRGAYVVPSELSLLEWLRDLARRLAQLQALAPMPANELLQSADGIWLGGLVAPEAFVTATRQVLAAELRCSLDELALVATLENSHPGAFRVVGVHLEGMSWTADGFAVTDALHTPLPALFFSWRPAKDLDDAQLRRLPVYLNAQRLDILFEVAVEVDPRQFGHLWTERAVAFTAWRLQ
ncbi:dynein heavy chain [Achlya hypogyna]|uniref:Dynein heavy chain, cytoplasmic n=1 Tax=Achlya hypogyna TaxID=1202772 RepID=A0A1V9Z3F8_ACHHY|nr:dynein heavy chain [Achlya hypogyna]